jgi:predicted DNA-binding transcriptional regulator YafY
MGLSLAIQRGEQVRLRYRSGAAETERRVDPYGLVFHWERWYLAAWCHLRGGLRVFRVDRVLSMEPVTERFERPAGFDSLALVMESLAMAPWGWEVEVFLETTLEAVEHRMPPGWAVLEEVDGGVLLRGQYDPLDWLAAQLLLLDCPVTVRKPPQLIETLRALGQRATALAERGAAAPRPSAAPHQSQAP